MNRILTTLILAGGCLATAPAQTLLTLDECKRLATENNATLRTARRNISAAEEQRKEAFTAYFPQVSATGLAYNANKDVARMEASTSDLLSGMPAEALSTLPQQLLAAIPSTVSMGMLKNGVVGGVMAVQPVFAGGQIVNSNKLARVGIEASQIQLERAENEVELTTEQYFWQVVSLREKLRTLDAVARMLTRLEQDATVAVEAGIANRNDLLLVQLKANETASARIKVENGLGVSRQLLAQHIGRHGDDIDVACDSLPYAGPLPTLPLTLRQDHQAALGATPEYRLLQKNTDASLLQQRLTAGKRLPTVGVGASYSYNNLMGDRDFGMVFATVSIPLSDWWGGTHAVRRQRLATDNAREQQQNSGELLVIAMDNAWNSVEDAHKQLAIASRSIAQAEENLRLNTDYYRAGTIAMSDLLDAQQQFQQTRDRFTDAYIDYELCLLKYRQATGQ